MRKSKRLSKPKPVRRRSISHKSLGQRMSEVISLRERVAQAELAAAILKTERRARTGLRGASDGRRK